MNIAKLHTVFGLGYLILGMCLGLYMALSNAPAMVVTHAHVLLIGGVLSILYSSTAKLWIDENQKGLRFQFLTHNIGTLALGFVSPLYYATSMSHAVIGPVLGVASLIVLVGTVQMLILVLKSENS